MKIYVVRSIDIFGADKIIAVFKNEKDAKDMENSCNDTYYTSHEVIE